MLISFCAQITSKSYHSIFTRHLLTSSSCSVTTLPWFLILEPVSPSVDKRYKFSSHKHKERILPALKPVVTLVKAAGKGLRIFHHWMSAIPTTSLTLLWVLWSIHHSASIQVTSKPSHPPPFQQYSWLRSVRRTHAWACNKKWGKIEDHLHSMS